MLGFFLILIMVILLFFLIHAYIELVSTRVLYKFLRAGYFVEVGKNKRYKNNKD